MEKKDLKIFIKIPPLRTARTLMRRIRPQDLEDVYAYASDPRVSEYLLWYPHPNSSYTRDYLAYLDRMYRRGEFYDWGVEVDGHMIGTAGFTSFDLENNSAEIGYVLNRSWWGKGFATEVARAVISFGFEILELQRISARYLSGNDHSRRVMEKCNMLYEGIQRDGVRVKGGYSNVYVYSITLPEYRKSKQ